MFFFFFFVDSLVRSAVKKNKNLNFLHITLTVQFREVTGCHEIRLPFTSFLQQWSIDRWSINDRGDHPSLFTFAPILAISVHKVLFNGGHFYTRTQCHSVLRNLPDPFPPPIQRSTTDWDYYGSDWALKTYLRQSSVAIIVIVDVW